MYGVGLFSRCSKQLSLTPKLVRNISDVFISKQSEPVRNFDYRSQRSYPSLINSIKPYLHNTEGASGKGACGTGTIIDFTGGKIGSVSKVAVDAIECMAHRGSSSLSNPYLTDGAGLTVVGADTSTSFPHDMLHAVSYGVYDSKLKDFSFSVIKDSLDMYGLSILESESLPEKDIFGPVFSPPELFRMVIVPQDEELSDMSSKTFLENCTKAYFKTEQRLHQYYLEEERASLLTRSHLFSLNPDFFVLKTIGRPEDFSILYPFAETIQCRAAIVHDRMSTDTPGGCWFSVQPLGLGTGFNGQDNSHHARDAWLRNSPLVTETLGFTPNFEGMSDTVKLEYYRGILALNGYSDKEIMSSIMPSYGSGSVINDLDPAGHAISSNGPGMMFTVGQNGEILIANDKSAQRYSGGFCWYDGENPIAMALMSEIGVADLFETRIKDVYPNAIRREFRGQPGTVYAVSESGEILNWSERDRSSSVRLIAEPYHSDDHQRPDEAQFRRHKIQSRISLDVESNILAPFISSELDWRPETVSMGFDTPSMTEKSTSLDDFLKFHFPEVYGPVTSSAQEGWVIDTSSSTLDKYNKVITVPNPMISSSQLGELKESINIDTISIGYDPSTRRLGFLSSLEDVLSAVKDSVSKGNHICLSDKTIPNSESPLLLHILISQVASLIQRLNPATKLIVESNVIFTPKRMFSLSNLGAHYVVPLGFESYVLDKEADVSLAFDKLNNCLKYYMAGMGIQNWNGFVGGRNLGLNTSVTKEVEMMLGLESPKGSKTVGLDQLTITQETRRSFGALPELGVRFWEQGNVLSMRKAVKSKDLDAIVSTFKEIENNKQALGVPGIRESGSYGSHNPLNIFVVGGGMAGKTLISSLKEKEELNYPLRIVWIEKELVPHQGSLAHKGIHPGKHSFKKMNKETTTETLGNVDEYFGGVELSDEAIRELLSKGIVIDASGASHPRRLGVSGEKEAYDAGYLHYAKDLYTSYNVTHEPKGAKKNIWPGTSSLNASTVIVGGGGVAADCSRMLLANIDDLRGNPRVDPFFIESLRRYAPMRVIMAMRELDPGHVSIPESDGRKLQSLVDDGVSFNASWDSDIDLDLGDSELKKFIHDNRKVDSDEHVSKVLEMRFGKEVERIEINTDAGELRLFFTDGSKSCCGNMIVAIGEESEPSIHEGYDGYYSIGWRKKLTAISGLRDAATQISDDIIDQLRSGRYDGAHDGTAVGYIDELRATAAVTKDQAHAVMDYLEANPESIIGPSNWGDALRFQTVSEVKEVSKSEPEIPQIVDVPSDSVGVKLPDGSIKLVSLSDTPFNDLESFINESLGGRCPDCGGSGTCGECAIRIMDPKNPVDVSELSLPPTTEVSVLKANVSGNVRGFRMACRLTASDVSGKLVIPNLSSRGFHSGSVSSLRRIPWNQLSVSDIQGKLLVFPKFRSVV